MRVHYSRVLAQSLSLRRYIQVPDNSVDAADFLRVWCNLNVAFLSCIISFRMCFIVNADRRLTLPECFLRNTLSIMSVLWSPLNDGSLCTVTVPGVRDYRKPLSSFTFTSLYLFLTDKSKGIAYFSMHKQGELYWMIAGMSGLCGNCEFSVYTIMVVPAQLAGDKRHATMVRVRQISFGDPTSNFSSTLKGSKANISCSHPHGCGGTLKPLGITCSR